MSQVASWNWWMEIGKSVEWVCGISANDFVGLGDFE